MICSDILRQFIVDLSVNDDTAEVIAHAFAKFGEQYRICELKMVFTELVTYSSLNEKSREVILYRQAYDERQEISYKAEYLIGESEKVIFEVYRMADIPSFSEEEKADLKAVMDIIYMHGMKWRMMNFVRDMEQKDSLTGLANVNGFLFYAARLLKKGVLMKYNAYYFNLERFGIINKRFGVKETDRIIARYAAEVEAFLTEDECLGRLGGDNFVALVRKERTEAFLSFLAGVQTYGILEESKEQLTIGAVAGILEIDESIKNEGSIINDCAVAMNEAKHIQKKPYMYATKALKEKVLRRKMLTASFPKAIQNKEFKAFYQPKVSIQDYTIVGAEALVRWQQDESFVSPEEFVSVFEQNGMVCELDFYILEQVCMDIRKWIERGITPVRISVNFSRKHLSNPNLAEDIMRVINKYEIDNQYIEIELTETVNGEEAELLIAFMNKMRKYNILMTIDDFGTGYASLNMLRSFKVDVLKIDKSLVDNMEETDRIILSSIVKMASELNMDVVAEGVGTWEQVDYLKTVKCGVVQGFLFDEPMPKEQFEEKMKLKKYEIVSDVSR